MAGEIPFYVEGKVVEIMNGSEIAIVRVSNGNLYHLKPGTPGIDFYKLELDQIARCEVTSMLTRVLSARIVGKINKE